MATYYVHKATRSKKVPYSFQCEHCVKDSGSLTAEIAIEVQENSHYRTLEASKQEKLNKAADKKLREAIAQVHKNATEKQVFAEGFKDECPHCKKPQSWSISGAKGNAVSTLIAILIVGVVISGGVYFSQGKDLQLTLIIGGAFAAFAVGYSVVKAVTITAKKLKTTSSLQKNLPVIDWASVQDYL